MAEEHNPEIQEILEIGGSNAVNTFRHHGFVILLPGKHIFATLTKITLF